jgi:hypothetical protein
MEEILKDEILHEQLVQRGLESKPIHLGKAHQGNSGRFQRSVHGKAKTADQ